jgi:hypothetical protein
MAPSAVPGTIIRSLSLSIFKDGSEKTSHHKPSRQEQREDFFTGVRSFGEENADEGRASIS